MALPAATVWEIRPTVGADTNGGGFVAGASGTDYSQQNSAQYNATDLAVDAITNTKVTSASHSFVATDVGNLINISAGGSWTLGFYEIVSVSGGAATLDRSPAAAGTTGGTYAVGGALATVTKFFANLTNGNTAYMKATGSYTVTTPDAFHSTENAGIRIIGYTSTRTDNGRVTWTTATNSTRLLNLGLSKSLLFKNIHFTNTAGTKADAWHADTGIAYGIGADNCIFDGFAVGINGDYNVDYDFRNLMLTNCEIKNCTSHGVITSVATAVGCFIHDNGGSGWRCVRPVDGGNTVLERCVIYNNTSHGVMWDNGSTTGALVLINTDVVKNGADGVFVNSTADPFNLISINSLYTQNTGYGINANGASVYIYVFKNNAYWNNSTAALNGYTADASDITLTGNPFNNVGTDFGLNASAGAGGACRGAGFEGNLAGSGSIDIGAVQTAGGGGSTTNYVFALNRTEVITEENY